MSKYIVEVGKMIYGTYTVHAESEEEAFAKAKDNFASDMGIMIDTDEEFDYENILLEAEDNR